MDCWTVLCTIVASKLYYMLGGTIIYIHLSLLRLHRWGEMLC